MPKKRPRKTQPRQTTKPTESELPRGYGTRAKRVKAELRELSDQIERRYTSADRERHHPYIHGPAVRGALRSLSDRYLPLPPDGRTKIDQEYAKRIAKFEQRLKRIRLK